MARLLLPTLALALGFAGQHAVFAAEFAAIAGYTPVSDVAEHAQVDLDQHAIEECLAQDPPDFDCAWQWYSEGGNSLKEDSTRTIQKFSTEAELKLDSEPWYTLYKAYWNDPAYGNTWVEKAYNGTDEYEGVEDVVRVEAFQKSTNYQITWMYVIHELEDAIKDCLAGDLQNNDGGAAVAWDEGWAFYAGSLEGTDGDGEGDLLYSLADKRCGNFGTCTGDDDGDDAAGTSAINAEIRQLWEQGQQHMLNLECIEALSVKDAIVDRMTVPLVQGTLRYLYKADPTTEIFEGDKGRAELWAFAAALLPRVDYCDATVAADLRANAFIGNDQSVQDGWAAMKEALETTYGCLGIMCGDVGGLLNEDGTGDYYEGFEPCSDDASASGSGGGGGGGDKMEPWAVALLTIFLLLAVGGLIAAGMCWRRSNRYQRKLQEFSANGHGHHPASTNLA